MAAVDSPHYPTLEAGVVYVADFKPSFQRIEVVSDGAAELFFTTNGQDPGIGVDGSHFLLAGGPNALVVDHERNERSSQVRMVSSGTPKVMVRGLFSGWRQIGAIQPVDSTIVPINFNASATITATAGGYFGFTARETAGAPAVLQIFDNATTASGTILEEIYLAANAADRVLYAKGIPVANGVYLQVTSGAAVGSVRVSPLAVAVFPGLSVTPDPLLFPL